MDPIRREVLKACMGRVCQIKREVADDKIIILGAAGAARKTVIFEPQTRIRVPDVLGHICGRAVLRWYTCATNVQAKCDGTAKLKLSIKRNGRHLNTSGALA